MGMMGSLGGMGTSGRQEDHSGRQQSGAHSLEELLDDDSDYLRARDLPIWDKDSREAQYVIRESDKGSGRWLVRCSS